MTDKPSLCTSPLEAPPWLAGLSESQRQVASYHAGPQLVTAGPGSGKTRTLCAWIVELIRSAAARPDEILAVTFTRRAAAELHERLLGLLGAQTDQLLIGTFHRLALRLAPLPPTLRVGDESERLQLIEQARVGSGTRKSPAGLLSLLSLRKGQYPDYRDRLQSGELLLPTEEVQVFRRYEQLLAEHGLVDLDDLLLRALVAWNEGSACRAFRFVAVDEYQDVSATQRALVVRLGQSATVLAIGDPDQAIYAFRGGEVRHFRGFVDDFPGSVSRFLVDNYRSTPQIVMAAAAVISGNSQRTAPPPRPQLPAGSSLLLWRNLSVFGEAQRLIREIECLVGGTSLLSHDRRQTSSWRSGDYGFADIAILTRTVARADAIASALGEAGLPYSRPSQPRPPLEPSGQPAIERCEPVYESDQLEDQRIAVLTLHGAKGLEFAVVFLVGLEATQLPGPGRSEEEREEERRLFYVGMTRAKELLYLSYVESPTTDSAARFDGAPSPFLGEVPIDLMTAEPAPKKRRPKPQLRLF